MYYSDNREILKMGCSSTAERAAVKEFVKALGSLSPSSWINKNTVSHRCYCWEHPTLSLFPSAFASAHHYYLVLHNPYQAYLTTPQARTVLSVVSTIYQSCSLEKASQKVIVERIGIVVEEVIAVFLKRTFLALYCLLWYWYSSLTTLISFSVVFLTAYGSNVGTV